MRKIGQKTAAYYKLSFEITLQVVILFLANFLIFSWIQKRVDLLGVIVALMMTYILVHYWLTRIKKSQSLRDSQRNQT